MLRYGRLVLIQSVFSTSVQFVLSLWRHLRSIQSEAREALGARGSEVYNGLWPWRSCFVDFIWDGHHVMVMGLKTFPGTYRDLLVPMATEAAGYAVEDVLAGLLKVRLSAVTRGFHGIRIG